MSRPINNAENISVSAPTAPLFWRSRAQDMTRILDGLDVIEVSVPEIAGRLD